MLSRLNYCLLFCTLFPSLAAAFQEPRDLYYYPGDTEKPLPLSKKLAVNVWLDQKAIWTSPFHMDGNEALTWLGAGALTTALLLTDRRTTHLFENSDGQVRVGNNVSRIGATYTLIPAVAGFYIGGVLADNQKSRETGILGGEALIDGLIVVEVLKLAAGRNRPNAPDQPGYFFKGGASFPSGHTIGSFALASVVAREYGNHKWAPFVAYGLAATVSAARFTARQHYASDVFVGGAMGYFIGQYVVNTHNLHAAHHRGVITPIAQPSTRTYGLNLAIVP